MRQQRAIIAVRSRFRGRNEKNWRHSSRPRVSSRASPMVISARPCAWRSSNSKRRKGFWPTATLRMPCFSACEAPAQSHPGKRLRTRTVSRKFFAGLHQLSPSPACGRRWPTGRMRVLGNRSRTLTAPVDHSSSNRCARRSMTRSRGMTPREHARPSSISCLKRMNS